MDISELILAREALAPGAAKQRHALLGLAGIASQTRADYYRSLDTSDGSLHLVQLARLDEEREEVKAKLAAIYAQAQEYNNQLIALADQGDEDALAYIVESSIRRPQETSCTVTN